MSFEIIIAALDAKRQGKRYIAKCPAHDDRSPSLMISEREDGSTGIHCFAGCQPDDILAAVGLDKKEAWKPRPEYNTSQHRASCERTSRIIALTISERKGLAGISAYLALGGAVQAATLRRYDEIVTSLFHEAPRIGREARKIIEQVQHEDICRAPALTYGELLPLLNRAMYRRACPGEKNYQQKVAVDKAVDICNHSAGSINNKSTPLTPVPLKRLIR